MKERFDWKPKGVVQIDKVKDDKIVESVTYNNLIVDRAHNVVRDLLFNGDFNKTLNILQVGDMNTSYEDDFTNLEPPKTTDTTLVNKIYQCEATKVTRYKDLNRYCVRLEFTVPKTAANNVEPSIYYNLVAEFGLFTRDLSMFSRLVKPIIKTRDIALNITWTIYI